MVYYNKFLPIVYDDNHKGIPVSYLLNATIYTLEISLEQGKNRLLTYEYYIDTFQRPRIF